MLLRALGYSTEELLNYYYDTETVYLEPSKKYAKSVEYDLLPGQRASRDIRHPDTREVLVKKNRKFTKLAIKKLKDSNVERLPVEIDELVGKVAATDVIDEATGEVILQCNEEMTESKLDELREHGIDAVQGPVHRQPQRRFVPARHADRRQAADAGRGDHGDLPPPAPGRSADARDGAEPVQQPVLQSRALRPVARSAA